MVKFSIPPGRENQFKKIGVFIIAILTIFIIFHGASSSSDSSGSTRRSMKQVSTSVKGQNGYKYEKVSYPKYTGPKVKATFVTLARNSDLYSLLESIKSVEDRFNHKFQYDWVFLNDEEFSDEFKNVTTAMVSGTTKYGLVPAEHWSFPPWIDQERAAKVRDEMRAKKIIYGDSISYRHMCRFESGFFYRHPLMDDYDWYWRVEPDIKLHCDIDYDIFKFMADNGKKYGFTISIHEYMDTIPTLWDTTKEFMKRHPEHVHKNNMMNFVSDDNGESYNSCHFWSNFEIASLDFWRGPAYTEYFDYLDKAGGFFYERWGDAPVHSIAAALFLDRNEIHHFGDLGYFHAPFHQCPLDDSIRLGNKCDCDPKEDFTWNGFSCGVKYYSVNHLKKPAGWQEHA
ncbi:alpha-1,2-mannosyltransferase KTR1 NDAI_0B04160 [Naumovozyma dairenensis CBS 421]|uniref:Glycosyltransferase family 15 protein n=1 Tax=Naumovozyma dairenensis (strain ATCC 10597 / BCRC 20456 / CBS 421 / NBRC 0211 / NRRL Y-12639) TaxID=1071378 RepID=G0W6N9_NAUDC|nr:hypothetical protein NDAI_0B04160 [Naumovozyma dairenensis CBS 421]CCD23450.1 hypothetical protein NDAI_0B04160 [Naumovozyma dairenensis CBS 421]